MRLINTSTRHFEEYYEPPRDAILSHRWGTVREEVSYEEYCQALEPEENLLQREITRAWDIKRRPGYTKIRKCCELAVQRNHYYVWIDTCCIDKRSSVELTEAINSVWKWYANSQE